ncbi:MAG: PAS domain S-box protein [Chloroflexi bacterium]|nr:PAS domain S-box protein [Chloroflexota bacterium]
MRDETKPKRQLAKELAHLAAILSIFLSVIALSLGDNMEIIPIFSPLLASPFFPFFHEIHDLLALVVTLYAAYKYQARLGVAAVLVYLAAHIPYVSLQFHKEAPETLRILFGAFVAFFGIWLIDRLHKSEELVRQTETRYHSLFTSLPDGFAYCRMLFSNGQPLDFVYLEVNDKFEELTGLHDVIGKKVTEVIPGIHETNPELLTTYGRVSLTGKPEEFETYLPALNIWLAISVYSPHKDHFVAVFNNITQSKRAEETIRESEEKYRTLVENALVGVYRTNLKGDILYVNGSWVKLLGFESAEEAIAGGAVVRYKNQNDRKVLIEKLTEKGRVDSFEVELLTKTGEIRKVIMDATLEGDNISGMLMDITERQQAEKTLVAQKELTDRILTSTPNAVLVIDRDLKIVLANQAFYQIFKVAGGGVEGKPLGDVLPIIELEEAISRTLVDQQFQSSMEFKYKLGSSEMTLVTHIIPMAEEEILLIFRNVTEERVRQEQQYHINRLASIGELVAGVAHELNNPLASVIGYSELVLSGELSPAMKSDIEVIHSNAQRAVTIVRNLLAFARRQEPQKRLLNVNDLIRHVMEMRGYELKVGNIEVITEISDELPNVLADSQQLEQVFLNIILNAEQAMLEAHNRGCLTIRTRARRGMVNIIFTDDGPGIPEENLWRVFNPFFTTKPPGKGTGLGLSICHGIITQHNGRISAESKLGEGATFLVELPLSEENKS